MEKECSKCRRKFHATQEDISVCPECLKNEFATAAPKLSADEHAALMAEYHSSMRRQSARAETMGGIYASGHAFNVAGTLRLALGLGIFAVCGFIFLVSDTDNGITFLTNEDLESQRLFSMIFCVVSAGLVVTASVYYKKTVYALGLFILLMGWFMPNMLQAAMKEAAKAKAAVMATQKQQNASTDENADGPVMTEADLQVFTSLKTIANRITHYAVFIDNQDSRARGIVRDALNRLLQAEYTRAYTRANGALYVATNVLGSRKNISQILSRFGTVTYAEPARGLYEIRFDNDKANLVSQFSPDVLTSPMNPSYVTANLSELRCVDPMRVRMSARSLANSNVRVLRGEIRAALLEVLAEPWESDPDTYAALIDAMVTYSQKQDPEATAICFNYFETRRELKREVAPDVIRYLILQKPEAMVRPMVDMWCENPIAWADMLDLLGYRVQNHLVSILQKTNDIRLTGSILKYLEEHGTKDAIPAVQPLLEHSDSIIRHSAKSTLNALQSRQ